MVFPSIPLSPATQVPAGGAGRAPTGDTTAPGWSSLAFPAARGILGGGDGAVEAAVARQGGPLTFTEWPFRAVKCPQSVEGCHINRCRPPAQSEECGAQWPNVRRNKALLLLPSTKAALSGVAGAGLSCGCTNPLKRFSYQWLWFEPREQGGATQRGAFSGSPLPCVLIFKLIDLKENQHVGYEGSRFAWVEC